MAHIFTDPQTKYLVSSRLEGNQWDAIRDSFNAEFKTEISSEAIRRRFRAAGYKPGDTQKKNEEEKTAHIHSDFTKEALGSIVKVNDYQEGTFFITAVAPTSYLDWSEEDHERAKNGEDVLAENLFEPGFAAVQNFLKRNNAELVLLPMPAHVKALQKQPRYYDPKLKEFKENFATEFTFNTHLKAIEAHLNPQQINPLTGLKRLKVHKYTQDSKPGAEIKRFKTSVIVAHSKQMMEVVPTGNDTHPRIVHSSGTITNPQYLRNRIGMIANEDHKLGGLIVEIRGDVFWVRQVQFDVKNGSFVDLGVRYHADGRTTDVRCLAFKMGDVHPGHHDQKALEAMYDLWGIIKPKRIFFEDFFDGASISHHLANKRLTRAKMPSQFVDLPTEIREARRVLEEIWSKAPKDAELIATASNHPEHVVRYLEEARYINDNKANYEIGHRMVVMSLDGKNPLKEYLDPTSRMNWTGENEDYFVEGVQMNSHGHLGLNGAQGSKQGHELAQGNAMIAHSHTPSIYHDVFTVGHMTHKRHGYNQGPSTWILCCGAVYKGGHKQLYMIIDGSAYKPKQKVDKK
ncbi:MAG TPA: hypothetical protein VIJ14_01295 [Rhabdochlamydiaceae bacterium]